jgi:hypothetical protein
MPTKILAWKLEGKTNRECAALLGLKREQTLYEWAAKTKQVEKKNKDGEIYYEDVLVHPELKEALETKKEDQVAANRISLFKQAVGYFVEDRKTTIFKNKNGEQITRVEIFKKWVPPIPISTFKFGAHFDKLMPRNSGGSQGSKGQIAEFLESLQRREISDEDEPS